MSNSPLKKGSCEAYLLHAAVRKGCQEIYVAVVLSTLGIGKLQGAFRIVRVAQIILAIDFIFDSQLWEHLSSSQS